MVERLVLKEVYKIKQASENGGESMQKKKHVEACLEAHSGVNTGVSEMVRVTLWRVVMFSGVWNRNPPPPRKRRDFRQKKQHLTFICT